MSSFFYLKVIASNKVYFNDRAELLVVPAVDGELGIMANHEDIIVAVEDGEMRLLDDDGNWHHVFVGKGFVQMINNRVLLLVETVERPEEIDVRRANEAKERALEQMRQKQSIQEYHHSQASLARAMSRLKTASKYRV